MTANRNQSERGGALLAVLWLSAALAAIAFSVANTVRTETERTSTFSEGVRTYYLATGAIERLRLYTEWGPDFRNPDGTARYFQPGTTRMVSSFPTGSVNVEIIPENAKLSLNAGKPAEIFQLMLQLGVDGARAQEITAAILDWRNPVPGGVSLFDQVYLAQSPSFRARHASFDQIEELLLVKGMTPDLFYGTVVRDGEGRLVPRPGLRDCLSVYAADAPVDANTAPQAVMMAVGIPSPTAAAIAARRTAQPFKTREELAPLVQFAGPAEQRLTVGGNTIFTFRATARLRLPTGGYSDMSRTVSAMLKYNPFNKKQPLPPVEVLRWYDY